MTMRRILNALCPRTSKKPAATTPPTESATNNRRAPLVLDEKAANAFAISMMSNSTVAVTNNNIVMMPPALHLTGRDGTPVDGTINLLLKASEKDLASPEFAKLLATLMPALLTKASNMADPTKHIHAQFVLMFSKSQAQTAATPSTAASTTAEVTEQKPAAISPRKTS